MKKLLNRVTAALLAGAMLCSTAATPVFAADDVLAEPTPVVELQAETPTEAPTEIPTDAPADAPTQAPTDAPAEAPTQAPTEAPAPAPVATPTPAPTETSTETPTDVPTDALTITPTEAPTETPTATPAEDELPVDENASGNASVEPDAEEAALVEQALTEDAPAVALFAMPVAPLAVGGETITAYTIKAGAALSDGVDADLTDASAFKLAAMNFTLAENGYNNSYSAAGDASFTFNISNTLRLDDNWLASEWDKNATDRLNELYMDAVGKETDEDKYNAYKLLNTAMQESGIDGPQYTYTYGKDFTYPPDFGTAGAYPKAINGVVDGVPNMPIANYTYQPNADGALQVVVTFQPYVLALNTVRADFTSELKLSNDLFKESGNVDIDWDKDHLVLEVTGNLSELNRPKKDNAFDSSKTTLQGADTTTPYIDYLIEFDVSDKDPEVTNLNELTMVDALPAGLMVESATVALDGADPVALDLDACQSVADGNYTLRYTFGTDGAKKAVFAVRAALTPAAYQEFMDKGDTAYTGEFVNTAELRNKDNEVWERTDENHTTMHATFFSKDGKQNAYDGNIFEWTIDANTSFSQSVGAFLVDEINPAQHSYEAGSLKIKVDDGSADTLTLNKTTDATLTALTYETLTNELIKADSSPVYVALKNLTSGGNAVYFDTADAMQMMVLPFDSYTNHQVEITYNTRLVKADTMPSHTDISNRAKLIWNRFGYGPGPGTPLVWNIDIGKRVTGTYDHVQKDDGDFNADTHTIGWDFKVNQFKQVLDNLAITEPSLYPANTTAWVYSKYVDGVLTGTADATLPQHETDDQKDFPYYVVSDNSDDTKSVIIYFGNVAANEYYDLHIETDATAELAVGSGKDANDKTTLLNSAHYHYTGDNGGDFVVEGRKTVENVLIAKDCVQAYDAGSKTIQWKISINMHKLDLSNAIVTDLLPDGNTFVSMDKVEKNGVEGQINGDTYSFGSGATVTRTTAKDTATVNVDGADYAGVTKNTETFTFNNETNDESSYTFTFTTKMNATDADVAYLNALITKNAAEEVTNTAQLSGLIGDKQITDKNGNPYVADGAATPLRDKALAKSGTFNADDSDGHEPGTITWTIELNKGQVDMGGKVVSDNFKNNSDPNLLQLVISDEAGVEPVKIEVADTNANGTIDYAHATDVTAAAKAAGAFLRTDDTGFDFQVPKNDTFQNKVLIFTFDTYVTDDADLSKVTNKVQLLTGPGGNKLDEVESGGVGAGDFWLDDYAEAQSSPYVRVTKLSASKDAASNNLLPLAGAEFTIEAYTLQNGVYTHDNTQLQRGRTTRTGGVVNFLNLRRGILYRITESDPPAGYTVNPVEKWCYFLAKDELQPDPSATVTVNVNGTEKTVKASDVSFKLNNTKAYTITVNDTATAKVQLTKYAADGTTPMKDVSFTLKRVSDNKVAVKTAQTNAAGVVEFAEVDPGAYEVYENYDNTALAGYENLKDKALLEVTVTDENTIAYAVGADGADYATVAADGKSASVRNKVVTTAVSLEKVDQNGNALPGVVFNLTATDTPLGYTWADRTDLATGTGGKLEIADLPCGSYTLTEDFSTGYLSGKIDETVTAPVVITFTVAQNTDGSMAVIRTDEGKTGTGVLTAAGGVFALGKITNTLIYTSIDAAKVSREANGAENGEMENIHFVITNTDFGFTLMTLKTNEFGGFTQNSDGSYTDAVNGKHVFLVRGSYTIQEAAAPQAMWSIPPPTPLRSTATPARPQPASMSAVSGSRPSAASMFTTAKPCRPPTRPSATPPRAAPSNSPKTATSLA